MKTVVIIPARLASTRLPRKLLLAETGKPLIQHTYEAARASRLAQRIIVAADDPEIVAAVENFGGEAWLTDRAHACGTDRIAEVASQLPEFDLVVNVQGDEPELSGAAIDLALSPFQEDAAAKIATLATPIRNRADLESPHCVKVVLDQRRCALYFSRAPIPFPRQWEDRWLTQQPPVFLQHIGLYVYRRDYLLDISRQPPCILEMVESLEQLRSLHRGVPIHVRLIEHAARGVDTLEDYRAFVSRNRNG